MPQLYDLYGDKTFDNLNKKKALKAKLAFMEEKGPAEGLPPATNALSTNLPGAYVPFGDQPEGACSTGESTAKEGAWCAKRQRQCGGVAVGFPWSEDKLAARTSTPLDHGLSLLDLTAAQQTWLKTEAQRHVDNGAWDGSHCVGIDSSLFAWGGVHNLKLEARGFWNDELRQLHITHLELEAVFKTVQAFLRELRGKVMRFYCDNQAVVAMLAYFISRNPDLMRMMRRLWSLLDLNDIELQARYIRSEANEWADLLSRDTGIDDWKLNRRWLDWAQTEWGEHTVDFFASEISAQLPRYSPVVNGARG
ncbi:hypothetical protein CYMTET_32557 [Cymbomonas tetramitiformis]|uniref:RNase H type-1 domain-containing protein n=1 Tax=Cymbomonas tetramitiformis TaxID=36881 RepID=A0AAE0KRQ9_9CHLO|nr:hypothetical protein CYMTET_32557 [Cymbomonas tetramitiformis]